MKSQNGFTLIEIIVVIAIISVLAAIVAGNVRPILAKARDARRIEDMAIIRKALDMYFTDNGYYPPSSCGWDCNGYNYSTNSTWQTLENYLSPYISHLPVDPINNASGPWNNGYYSYAYGNVGRNTYPAQYDLTAQLETSNHPQSCQNRCWRWYFSNAQWCTACGGTYSNQIYEASPQR